MRNVDPIKSWSKLFDKLKSKIMRDLHVASIGRVTNVNGNKANVQLLAKEADKDKTATIHNAYILDHVGTLNVGDIVAMVFTDLPLEDFSGDKEVYNLTISRRHSINDAIIIGKVKA